MLTGQILEISDPRWLDFTCAVKNSCIFHHPAWVSLLAQTYGYRAFLLAAIDTEGNIQAGLPVMEINTFASRRWTSLPFSDHCAPLAVDEEALRTLTDFVTAAYQDLRPASLELRWSYPTHPHLYPKDLFVIHNLRLDNDFDATSRQIHNMHRRNAMTAQRRDVHLHWGNGREDLKEFYNLHLETRHRQGTPIQPWSFFENLRAGVLEKGLGFVLLAYHGRTCLAAAVFLHWGEIMTYKYGASSTEGLTWRPNHLIFWEAIRWGCEHGYSIFDMGRTNLENVGLRNFKNRWGAVEDSLYYSFNATSSQRSSTKRLKKVVKTVIRNSPQWVCRLSGELLYRHFG